MTAYETPSLSLEDRPDWRYLLIEVLQLYRSSPAGGSAPIRTHQRSVRERLNKAIVAQPALLFEPPQSKPVCVHLGRALDNGERGQLGSLVRSVAAISDHLVWRYGYDRLPGKLHKRYGYAEILGPNGPVFAHDLILGVVLFAPKTTYPAHAHKGVSESYYVLSGAASENDTGVYIPGSLIFNRPGHSHRLTTSDLEPVLLLYAWTGDPDDLATQTMVFDPRKPKT